MPAVTRPQYRFADNAVGSTSNEYGNHILRRGMGEIRKPTWNRTETVVRFLPYWNFEENRWEPFRRSPAPMDFGDWIRRYEAVRGFGEAGITMLLYDPIANPAYDVQSNPCVILYRAINAAIDNRQSEPDWPALFKGGNNRRAVLARQQPIYLSRTGIFRIKSKDMATSERAPLGLASGDPAFFLELPKTAGEKLISLLEERNEDFQGDPDDIEGAYAYGDIVSLDKGGYVHIFEEGSDPRANQSTVQQGNSPRQLTVGTGGRGNYGGSSGGGGSMFKGYDMFIAKTWNGFSPALSSPELERLIKSKQRPWEECLQFYNHQEQAFLVQDGFPPSAILYAWRDHPEWIKDETRSKAVGRTSVAMDPRVKYPGDDSFRQSSGANVGGGPRQSDGPGLFRIGSGNTIQQESGATSAVVPPKRSATTDDKSVRGDLADSNGPAEASREAGTQDQALKVGGWGAEPSREEGSKDTVVPQGIDTNVPQGSRSIESPQVPLDREQRALAALEAARARNVGR